MSGSRENGRVSPAADDVSACMQLRDRLIAEHAGVMPADCAVLLAEAAEALRLGARLRELAEEELFSRSASGRHFVHPGVAASDTEIRRAALLISRVAGMVKSREPVEQPEGEDDPFVALDALGPVKGLGRAGRPRRKQTKTE